MPPGAMEKQQASFGCLRRQKHPHMQIHMGRVSGGTALTSVIGYTSGKSTYSTQEQNSNVISTVSNYTFITIAEFFTIAIAEIFFKHLKKFLRCKSFCLARAADAHNILWWRGEALQLSGLPNRLFRDAFTKERFEVVHNAATMFPVEG